MESKPFSAPSKEVESENPAPEILPPATVTIGGPSPVNVLHSTSPHQIIVQEKGSNTVANVFMILGAVGLVLTLILGALSASTFPDLNEVTELKTVGFQEVLDDTIVFSSDGNTTNESFVFDTDIRYNVRAAQGVTINSISILDENNNTLFFEDDCKDGWNEDGIDECTDYTTVSIGNLNLERAYVGSAQFINGTININATGEVTINNLDDNFWEEIFLVNEEIDAEQFGAFGLSMFGACLSCCFGAPMLLVGVIARFA